MPDHPRTATCRNCASQFTYSSGGGLHRPLCQACEATYKWCPKCGYAMVREAFHHDVRNRDGLSGMCRRCISEKHKKHHYTYSPEQRRRSKLKSRYGVTPEQFDEMVERQAGLCAICSVSLKSDVDRFAHVDHCHETMIFRGVLCAPCNKGLGHFRDDVDRLTAAALYLIRAREVPTEDAVRFRKVGGQ